MANSDPKLIFLVDDDKIYVRSLENFLSEKLKGRVTLKTFATGEACLAALGQKPDIVFLDYYLNSREPNAQDGITILQQLLAADPELNVVMLSGQDQIDVAVACIQHGAYDYIVKTEGAPVRAEKVTRNIIEGVKQGQLLQVYKKGFYTTIVAIVVIIVAAVALFLWIR